MKNDIIKKYHKEQKKTVISQKSIERKDSIEAPKPTAKVEPVEAVEESTKSGTDNACLNLQKVGTIDGLSAIWNQGIEGLYTRYLMAAPEEARAHFKTFGECVMGFRIEAKRKNKIESDDELY